MKYFFAELYRSFRKKSFLLFMLGAALFLMLALFIVNVNGTTELPYLLLGGFLIQFSVIVVGVVVLALIYTDDFKAKSLPTIIAGGKSRSSVILTKIAVGAVVVLVVYLFFSGIFLGMTRLMGLSFSQESLRIFLFDTLGAMVSVIGYFVFSSIVAYASFSSGLTITTFLLLSTGVVFNIAVLVASSSFVKNTFGDITPYFFTNAVKQISQMGMMEIINWKPLTLVGGYLVLGTGINTFLFSRKELTF
ncbi:MAG: hypothetical protein GX786_02665 [Clostridiales bacterium]|nr:hypothetical protein [Clostridiales bacterium]